MTGSMNDANLWGLMVWTLLDEAGLESEPAQRVARDLIAHVRFARDPQRTTWSPATVAPSEAWPARVVDVDGTVWVHQPDHGPDRYRISTHDRRVLAAANPDFDGTSVRAWADVMTEHGPLTNMSKR